jgi:hypothetical protein
MRCCCLQEVPAANVETMAPNQTYFPLPSYSAVFVTRPSALHLYGETSKPRSSARERGKQKHLQIWAFVPGIVQFTVPLCCVEEICPCSGGSWGRNFSVSSEHINSRFLWNAEPFVPDHTTSRFVTRYFARGRHLSYAILQSGSWVLKL